MLLIVPEKAAVDEQGCAGDVRAFVRGKVGSERSNVGGLAEAFERNVLEKRVQFCRVIEKIFVYGRFDGARRDGIDGDAEGREFDG